MIVLYSLWLLLSLASLKQLLLTIIHFASLFIRRRLIGLWRGNSGYTMLLKLTLQAKRTLRPLQFQSCLSEVTEMDEGDFSGKLSDSTAVQDYQRQINCLLCLIYCYLRVLLCRNDSLTNPNIITLYIKSAY